jgi:uncharacterized small protein (DUF1192 family)
MKPLVVIAALTMTPAAAAQEPSSNEAKALGSMIVDAAQREAQLRAQIFALQDEVARLKAQAKIAENKEAPRP